MKIEFKPGTALLRVAGLLALSLLLAPAALAQRTWEERKPPRPKYDRPSSPVVRHHRRASNASRRNPNGPARIRLMDQVEDAIEEGNRLREAASYSAAESKYRDALALNSGEWRAHYGLGNVYHDQNKNEEAAQSYSRVIELNPGFAEARYWLGISLRSLRRYPEAIEQFKQVIHMEPRHGRALYNLGNSYFDQRRYAEAIDSYKEALNTGADIDRAGVFYKLGKAYLAVNDRKAATEQYERLRPLNPTLAQSLLHDINQ